MNTRFTTIEELNTAMVKGNEEFPIIMVSILNMLY